MEIKRIFFPTDFSERSLHALPYAVEMAKTYSAKLYVLHVIYDMGASSGLPLPEGAGEAMYAELEEIARKELESLEQRQQMALDGVEYAVIRGLPYQEILKFAQEKDVDLIVIGTHGKTGNERVKFGSTTQRVVRRAPCPVLTVI